MTLITNTLAERPAGQRMRELADDLMATWSAASEPDCVGDWMSRPSILRRVASELAEFVPADVDRIIAIGPGALTLGGAVSLTTGLPFCALQQDDLLFGTYHAGETVIVIASDERADLPAQFAGLTVSARLSVLAPATGVSTTALFVMDDEGCMLVQKGATHG